MTTRTPNLRGLIALAKRDGVDIRPTLVRVITDLFVQEPVHSPAEVARYVELARHMLEGVDETSRLAVAMRLARYPGAPREILMMLAADTIEVAELVLIRANFAEADLHHLADTLDAERRQIIAERKDLPAAVAARLGVAKSAKTAPPAPAAAAPSATASAPVIKDVAAKDSMAKEVAAKEGDVPDASLSHDLGKKAAAASSPAASEWERPLGLKPVTPITSKPIAESLPAWMTKPAPAAEPVVPAASTMPASAPPAAAKPVAEPLPAWRVKSAETPAPAAASAALERAAVRLPPASPAAPSPAITELEQAALKRKPEEFIDRLARLLDLDRAKAEEVVCDPSGQPVAVACRALDMPCDVFSRIMLFLDPTIGRSVALVFSLAEYYGRLSVAEANEVVASWRGPKRAALRHAPLTAADGAGRHSFEPRRLAAPQPGTSRVAARG